MLVTLASAQAPYSPPVPYAVTRQLDPGRGEVQMSGASWARGQPMVEIAVRVLRTPRGSYLMDPKFGVDMSPVQTLTSGSAAAFKAAIYQAFDFYIKRGFMKSFAAKVTQPASNALFYDVSFVDPRAQLLAPGSQLSIRITGP